MARKNSYELAMERLIEEVHSRDDKALMRAIMLSVEELKRASRERLRGQKKPSE